MASKTSSNVAWGLEFGGSALRLVRVTRSNSGYHADGFVQIPLDNRWEKAVDTTAAIQRMAAAKITGPLVACVSDELILFRTLSLPQAQTALLDKMVQGQLEVLIPTHTERFASGYRSYADSHKPSGQRVLLCAARRETLTDISQACKPLTRQPEGLTPSILALAAICSRLDNPTHAPLAVLDVAARSTGIALIEAGQVVQCAVLDSAGDRWTESVAEKLSLPYSQAEQRKVQYFADPSAAESDPDVHQCLQQALAEWSAQLRDLYQHCLAEIPQDRRPKRCILFGQSARTPAVSALIADTLGLQVDSPATPNRLSLAQGMDFTRSAAAIGTALYALESDWPIVNLSAPQQQRPVARKISWWRWAALLIWLLAAMLTLYSLDRAEAGKLNNTLTDVQAKMEQQGGLSRQLAIGDYLDSAGPTPLNVLDRVSQALPKKALLANWTYNSNGDVTVRGTVPNEKDFQTMYAKLCEVATVDFKSGQPNKGKFHFEFRLSLARLAEPPASEPPAKEDSEPTPAETSPADSQKTTEQAEKPDTSEKPEEPEKPVTEPPTSDKVDQAPETKAEPETKTRRRRRIRSGKGARP